MHLQSIESVQILDRLRLSATSNNLDRLENATNVVNQGHQIALDLHQILIRPVREDEINSVADIITRSFHFDQGWRGWFTPLFRLGIAEDLRHRVRSSANNTYRDKPQSQVCSVAAYTQQGQTSIAGTVEIGLRTSYERSRQHRYVYISNLAVSSSFRRRGVALELLTDCEQITKTWGYTELYLHVMADNPGGRNLYQRLGYETVSTEFLWSIIPWHRPERLFLRKQLV